MELSNQEMESSKQEMELFLPLPGFWWKNFFYNIFFICSKVFKIDFQNRKRNYPNRKWNYFSHLIKKKVFYKMLLICSKGFKINYYATKIVVPLKSDHEIKDQILVHQVPTSHGFKRRIDSQSQHQTMFSESFKIDYTLKSGHKNAFVVYLYISLRIVISIHSFLTTLINKMKLMITYFRKKKQL